MKTSLLSLSSLLILSSAFALSACGGGGGSDDDSANADGETGRHVYFRYYLSKRGGDYRDEAYAGNAAVQVANNCDELRRVEDNDGEIKSETDNGNVLATVTVTNGEVVVDMVSNQSELMSAGFGHCSQAFGGNTFESDIRCYDDNEIFYLKAEQDNYADGEAACTDGVGGSLEE